jgi:hypothetical protein
MSLARLKKAMSRKGGEKLLLEQICLVERNFKYAAHERITFSEQT